MKKYKLTQITSPAPDGVRTKTKLYTIYLAPGCKHSFKSYRAAQNFAAEYSRQINQGLHCFNLLLSELYTAHRAAWFYYYDGPSEKNDIALEQKINGCIGSIEKNLHNAAFNCSGTWGAGRIWQIITAMVEDFKKAFELLATFLFSRRLYVEAEKMKIYILQAENELQRIAAMFNLL